MATLISPNHTLNMVWDVNTLQWVVMQQPLIQTGSLTVSADVSDRAGRLLGHVTVDNASLAVTGVDQTATAAFTSSNAGPTTLLTPGGGSVVMECFLPGTPSGASLFVEVLIGATWYPAEGMAYGPSLTNPVQNFLHISNGLVGPSFFQNGTTNWVTWLATGTQMRFSTTSLLASGGYTISAAFKPGASNSLSGAVLIGNQSNLAADVTSDNKLHVCVTRPGDGTPVVIINADGQTPAGSAYTPPWGALPYFFNGSTWDRARGDATNGLFVNVKKAPAAATATLSNVAASASNVTLLAANSARMGFALYNQSSSPVNVKFGATASATSFTVRLLGNGFVTSKDFGVPYTGLIDAIWDSATGDMRVTELTA